MRGVGSNTKILALVGSLGLFSCDRTPPKTAPAEAIDAPRQTSALISRIRKDGSPAFTFVVRRGDPEAALAVTFRFASVRETSVASALLARRFERGQVRTGPGFVQLSFRNKDHAALEKDLAGIFAFLGGPPPSTSEVLSAWNSRKSLPPATGGECSFDPRPTKDPGAAPTRTESDAVAAALSTSSRVAVGVTGPLELERRLRGLTTVELPGSAPLVPKSPPARTMLDALIVEHSGVSAGTLLAARDRLAEGTLRDRLANQVPRLASSLAIEFVPRPESSCLRIRVPNENANPSARELAVIRRAVTLELALTTPGDDDGLVAEELLARESAEEAARLASLLAFPEPTFPGKGSISSNLGPAFDSPEVEKLERELQAREAPATLPLVDVDESGQSKALLLVGSPCGVAPEAANVSGERALLLHTLAASFSGKDDVELAPWISADGIGLVASARPRKGEGELALARRLASSVGRALTVPSLDAARLGTERQRLFERIGDHLAFGVGTRLLAPDHPSLLSPLGTPESLERLAPSDLAQTLEKVLSEPLRAVFLRNGAPAQTKAVSSELLSWLGPRRALDERECPAVELPPPPLGGVWTLRTVDEKSQSSRSVLVPLRIPRETGRSLLAILTRPGGPLDVGLRKSGLVTEVRASYVGSSRAGGFWFEVHAEADALGPAEQQLRGVLDTFANTALTEADFAFAKNLAEDELDAFTTRPLGRLVRHFVARSPHEVTLAELESAKRALEQQNHLLLRVERRK